MHMKERELTFEGRRRRKRKVEIGTDIGQRQDIEGPGESRDMTAL